MLKNIYNLGDSALYCDFGNDVSKEINLNVIKYFQILKNNKIDGITNLAPSYNKLVITFDFNLHFMHTDRTDPQMMYLTFMYF